MSRPAPRFSVMCTTALLACAPPADEDPADLTAVARALEWGGIEAGVLTARDIPSLGGPPMPGTFEAPETVRMWLRSEGSAESCSGTVVEVELEEYIRHVIPHEWYASWHEESLMAGATAARSYAAWWVMAGGKYDCADVCDTSYTQNYGETTDSRTDAAILATQSTFIMDEGAVVFAEYSAENGDPTEYGVSEPHCTGEARYGHGRGLCQWGSQRWASDADKDHEWMADHYYLGATLLGPLAAERLDDEGVLSLEAGESVTLELVWENQGSTSWYDGEIHLDTVDPVDRPSDFQADVWATSSRATSIEEDVSPGQIGTIDLTLVAPQVEETTSYVESFGLYSSALDAWVPDDGTITLEIAVYPAGEVPEEEESSGGSDEDDERTPSPLPAREKGESESGCGCSGAVGAPMWGLWVALLALWRRREV